MITDSNRVYFDKMLSRRLQKEELKKGVFASQVITGGHIQESKIAD
jgi:hypothetical protein